MSPLFYEDSLGAKLVEKANAAMDAAREQTAHPESVELSTSDTVLVEDPEALAQAELAVRRVDPEGDYEEITEDWVAVMGPSKLSGLIDNAGFSSRLVTAPLDSADIPYAWDPYPPEEMPGYRVGYGAVDRPFTLFVPPSYAGEARGLLTAGVGSATVFGLPATVERGAESSKRRRRGLWVFFWLFVGFDLVILAVVAILTQLGII
jgi:hypothetical protein